MLASSLGKFATGLGRGPPCHQVSASRTRQPSPGTSAGQGATHAALGHRARRTGRLAAGMGGAGGVLQRCKPQRQASPGPRKAGLTGAREGFPCPLPGSAPPARLAQPCPSVAASQRVRMSAASGRGRISARPPAGSARSPLGSEPGNTTDTSPPPTSSSGEHEGGQDPSARVWVQPRSWKAPQSFLGRERAPAPIHCTPNPVSCSTQRSTPGGPDGLGTGRGPEGLGGALHRAAPMRFPPGCRCSALGAVCAASA